jgi:hypothetical protein
VNRCLTEGRRSFLRRVERIETGAECERLAPLLSALADGEATARDMAVLRPHLRSCLSCRAALRDAREVPARVAALAPIGLLAGGAVHPGGGSAAGGWLGAFRSAGDWINERIAGMTLRGQELLETASSHKLAAAAASAAALGGGGIATVQVSGAHDGAGAGAREHRPAPVVVTGRGAAERPRWRLAANVAPATARSRGRPLPPRHERPRRTASRPQPGGVETPAPKPPAAEPNRSAPGAVAPAAAAPPPERGPRTPRSSGGETGEFGP